MEKKVVSEQKLQEEIIRCTGTTGRWQDKCFQFKGYIEWESDTKSIHVEMVDGSLRGCSSLRSGSILTRFPDFPVSFLSGENWQGRPASAYVVRYEMEEGGRPDYKFHNLFYRPKNNEPWEEVEAEADLTLGAQDFHHWLVWEEIQDPRYQWADKELIHIAVEQVMRDLTRTTIESTREKYRLRSFDGFKYSPVEEALRMNLYCSLLYVCSGCGYDEKQFLAMMHRILADLSLESAVRYIYDEK